MSDFDEHKHLLATIAEQASELEALRADLISCRGTVKTELHHYERLAMVHGKTAAADAYDAEAKRLASLLDRIDAATQSGKAVALRADAARGRKLADWLQRCGLLRTEFCNPGIGESCEDWWVLHKPYMIDVNGCEGYGKTEIEAIDAAMQAGKAVEG